jgi:hypothetical protein
MNQTQQKLNSIIQALTHDIARANSSYRFTAVSIGIPLAELRVLAEKLHYDPNTSDYFQSTVMILAAATTPSRVVVCFQGVGAAFRGLLAVTAYFQVGDGPPLSLSEDIFRISYEDSLQELGPRYEKWIDACLINALAQWRRTLV